MLSLRVVPAGPVRVSDGAIKIDIFLFNPAEMLVDFLYGIINPMQASVSTGARLVRVGWGVVGCSEVSWAGRGCSTLTAPIHSQPIPDTIAYLVLLPRLITSTATLPHPLVSVPPSSSNTAPSHNPCTLHFFPLFTRYLLSITTSKRCTLTGAGRISTRRRPLFGTSEQIDENVDLLLVPLVAVAKDQTRC